VKAPTLRKVDGLVITLHTTREFHVRLWLATQLVRLAARILGGRAEVKT
jgi:hypothetical protein